MEMLIHPNNHVKLESEIFFDRKSRDNYFEMLEVALMNLSKVDWKKESQKLLVQE